MNQIPPWLEPLVADRWVRPWLRLLGLAVLYLLLAVVAAYTWYADFLMTQEMLSHFPPDQAQRYRVLSWVLTGLFLVLAFVFDRYGTFVARVVSWPFEWLRRRRRRRVPRGRPR